MNLTRILTIAISAIILTVSTSIFAAEGQAKKELEQRTSTPPRSKQSS